MSIHLHHAISSASQAITELSSITLWDGKAGLEHIVRQSILSARDQLAKASAELNAYDAKRNSKQAA